jgi:hypothetical protein
MKQDTATIFLNTVTAYKNWKINEKLQSIQEQMYCFSNELNHKGKEEH